MKERMLSLVGFSTQRNSLKTEVLAGITTFVTMSYILALNPVLFAPIADRGYPIEALFTTTALAATIGSLLMAFLAKRPMGQAPGLALNIFFIQTVCVSLGYSWRFALTAVLIEGILFILLCMSNIRQIIFDMFPPSLKFAFAAGIGFFIAMIGFKNSGILAEGTIFNHIETLMNPNAILFLFGLLLAGILTVMHVRGGLLLSIVIISLIGIPFGVTQLPQSLVSIPASPAPLICQFSWDELLTPDLWVCVLTMLFFDVFDTLGSVVGLMANSGLIRKNGRIPNMRNIMLSDAIGTVGNNLRRECHRRSRRRTHRSYSPCYCLMLPFQSVLVAVIPGHTICRHCACNGHCRFLSVQLSAPYQPDESCRDIAGIPDHSSDACQRKHHRRHHCRTLYLCRFLLYTRMD